MDFPFERGVFTLSLDFELVWGSRDLTADITSLVGMARVTRASVFPALLSALSSRGFVATWATVGHLFLHDAARQNGTLHPDIVPPTHTWRTAPWFEGVPEGNEDTAPAFYGQSLVEALRDAGQEVGSHSFSHPIFGDPGCSREAAESDLRRCVAEADRLGVKLRSFVFPRNVHGHLDLLAKYGFTSWRPQEPIWYRRPPVPGALARLLHLADVARAATPPTVMPRLGDHGLWEIPASATFLPIDGIRRTIPMGQRVQRCIRGLNAAADSRRIFHLYTHPINLASDPGAMLAGFNAVFDHAARLRDAGRLHVRSMGQLTDELRAG